MIREDNEDLKLLKSEGKSHLTASEIPRCSMWTLKLRRWRNSDHASTVLGLFRYLPYVACVVVLKVYVVMLLVNSRDQTTPAFEDYDDDYSVQQELRTTTPTTTTEEPGWREKQEVLLRLNDTVISPSANNRTPDTIWLFFNRIPRTGGQTLVSLMKSLSADLDYQHQEHVYRTPWQRLMSEDEQKNLATWFEYNFWPKSYDRFSLYINFTQHRSQYVTLRPAYITVVRDPVEKYISYFRFKRVDHERVKLEMAVKEKQRPGSGRTWYWKKLEECVSGDDPECDFSPGSRSFSSAVPFFCGQYEQCLKLGDPWALQKAKYQAEYDYSVVGLAEEWNTTLAVLEEYLPMFFQGARQRYWSQEFEAERQVNKNPKKYSEVPEKIIKLLKERMGPEYELYEFLRQRLHLQYKHIASRLAAPTTAFTTTSNVPRFAIWDRMDIEFSN
ncbi:heparan sulfate 2-O-sulfotransferase 1-like [Homarus americanus]|uniref:Heparan sulfate 2-O-sulfotransferase pipe-like 2 n=2 Tax=Homarus americanus TaxID=6706 RepID=A0A8J5J919_HOMAM|nr:heparan sulfate 2-O-sulfotransferase 1-like [Homarus americanus]KAG7153551.1 Heparan sulfate 2-O-sulfotransferase pipe-like 2 [Homarus americanus]